MTDFPSDTVFDIAFGALERTPQTLVQGGMTGKLLLVADKNTWTAAGERACAILTAAGWSVTSKVFEELESAQMETAQELAALTLEVGANGILAVGTGTLNDLSRYASFLNKIPFAVIGTAASMDGFCSGVAPLIENGFKRTYNAHAPRAVIGDGSVMDDAPSELTAAGLGDLLGKYTCLADWKIAHILTGESFSIELEKMVRTAVNEAVAAVPSIQAKTSGSTLPLMRALCLSGVAMALCGSSRPASGAEHHLSHFWEMRFLQEGRKAIYHGAKVGVATGVVADLYHRLAEIPDITPFLTTPPKLTRERLLPSCGPIADDILRDNENDPTSTITPEAIASHWREIRKIIDTIPSSEEIRTLLTALGGPALPEEIGISPQLKQDGILFGRYVRPRLTLLRLTDFIQPRAWL